MRPDLLAISFAGGLARRSDELPSEGEKAPSTGRWFIQGSDRLEAI